MNAERLNAICLSVQHELESLSLVSHMNQLVQALQNVVSNPQPSHQTQLTTVLEKIYSVLSNSPSDHFSPAWRQALEETGISEYIGESLDYSLHEIFERNQITPATALKEVQGLSQGLQNFSSAINNLISSFDQLSIGSEDLEPGECELGVLVPRKAIDNDLNQFGKELQELNVIFNIFSEVSTGKRDGFEIKTISSTDLSIYLAAIPPIAACVAHAAERIVNLYKSLLEIRKLRADLKEKGVPEDKMQGITDHANSMMSNGIEDITVEIITNYYTGKDGNRKNELTNGVRIALNKIANRIDQGFNIEVRAEPLPNPKEDEKPTKSDEQFRKHITRIRTASKTLEFIHLEGERILCLPEKEEKKKS